MYCVSFAGSKRMAAAESRRRKEQSFLDGLTISVPAELSSHLMDEKSKLHTVHSVIEAWQKKKLDLSRLSFVSGQQTFTVDDVLRSFAIIADCSKKIKRASVAA